MWRVRGGALRASRLRLATAPIRAPSLTLPLVLGLGGCGVAEISFVDEELSGESPWSIVGTEAGAQVGNGGFALLPPQLAGEASLAVGVPQLGEGGLVALHALDEGAAGARSVEAGVALIWGEAGDLLGGAVGARPLEAGGAELLLGAPGAGEAAGALGWVALADLPDESRAAEVMTEVSGEAPGDGLGAGVASGDLDGDGVHEVIAGAPGAEEGAGRVLVWTRDALAMASVADDAAWSVTSYRAGDGLGRTLISGVDVDGDGLHDLLACAPRVDVEVDDVGACALILGGMDLDGERESMWEAREALFHGVEAGALAGSGTRGATLADLDGDGTLDLLVGLPGSEEGEGAVAVFLDAAREDLVSTAEADLSWSGRGGLGASVAASERLGQVLAAAPEAASGAGWLWRAGAGGETLADSAEVLLEGEAGAALGSGGGLVLSEWSGEDPVLAVSAPSASPGAQTGGAVFLLSLGSEE